LPVATTSEGEQRHQPTLTSVHRHARLTRGRLPSTTHSFTVWNSRLDCTSSSRYNQRASHFFVLSDQL